MFVSCIEIVFVQSNNATFTTFNEGVYVGADKRHTEPLKGFDIVGNIGNLEAIQIEFRE